MASPHHHQNDSHLVPIDDRYGPGALLTPANVITVLRLVLSPLLLVMIVKEPSSWAAFAFWTMLALTDGIDGHLARRHGTTRSGAFLDPLADKVLVLGTMASLVNVGVLPLLPVLLIAVRELGISVYRSYWAKRSLAIPARKGAKVKTVVQEAALGFGLLPPFGHQRPAVAVTVLFCSVTPST